MITTHSTTGFSPCRQRATGFGLFSRRTAGLALLLAGLAALGCEQGSEQEAAPALVKGGGDAVTVWTEGVELFFEYPPLVAGAPGEGWAIHLTTLADFQPVLEGSLTLRFRGPGGATLTDVEEAPARPGIYTNAPSFSAPGMYDLTVEYRGQGMEEVIPVGPVQVFASEADLPMVAEEEHAGISFLKEQQWPIEFETVRAAPRVVQPGIPVTGEVMGPADGMARITAPVEGLIRWEENRSAPAEGARVGQGQTLVRLAPVGGDNTYAVLVSRAELLRREVGRSERLVAAEAAPARRLDEARLELQMVEAQLAALDAPPEDGFALTLRSPIDGSVTGRHFTVGERVAAGDPLYTILNPDRVWIRFHLPASHAARSGEIRAATFSPEGSEQVVRSDRLLSVGSALDPDRRSLPVTFQVSNPEGILKAGMLVQGQVLLTETAPTLAVPAQAVTDENGMLVAYVQLGGESFERRPVTIGESDGQWTTILSGLQPGEHVVTRGAYQVRLASLNTSELSDHGHVH